MCDPGVNLQLILNREIFVCNLLIVRDTLFIKGTGLEIFTKSY